MNLLNIKPSCLSESGDCLGAIICKLFEYYGLHDYEIVYKHSGQLCFEDYFEDREYDINKYLSFGYLDYDQILNQYFGIKSKRIGSSSIDKITFLIDNSKPVILYTYNAWCPWRNHTEITPHYCLIIGYDLKRKVLYCLDPLYTGSIETYPFSNLANTSISYYDISTLKSSYLNNPKDLLDIDYFA